jgi:hypothetical membrane protein
MSESTESMASKISLWFGPGLAGLWIIGVLISTFMFPSFIWTKNTFAEIGRSGGAAAFVFDFSVVTGSLLGLLFLIRTWQHAINNFQKTGIALLAALFFLTGIAQLGLGNPWLEVFALSFIFLLLPAFALIGSGDVLAGHPRRGIVTFWLGIVHSLSWQILSVTLEFSSSIPTFISFFLISIWTFLQFFAMRGNIQTNDYERAQPTPGPAQ